MTSQGLCSMGTLVALEVDRAESTALNGELPLSGDGCIGWEFRGGELRRIEVLPRVIILAF